MVPLLTLGIPGSATARRPAWGADAARYPARATAVPDQWRDRVWAFSPGCSVACFAQLLFGLIGVPLWIKVISAPRPLLLTIIAVISVVGSYGYNNSIVDVWVMFAFGIVGLSPKEAGFPGHSHHPGSGPGRDTRRKPPACTDGIRR